MSSGKYYCPKCGKPAVVADTRTEPQGTSPDENQVQQLVYADEVYLECMTCGDMFGAIVRVPPTTKEYVARVTVSKVYDVYVQAAAEEEAETLVRKQIDKCADDSRNWTFKEGPSYKILKVQLND